ncbi:MAG: hypothetical protein HPY54_05330 [Chthonomonadetes bacterium]|nr:hypothetical protein [Chthonomonadetes bacterium]
MPALSGLARRVRVGDEHPRNLLSRHRKRVFGYYTAERCLFSVTRQETDTVPT